MKIFDNESKKIDELIFFLFDESVNSIFET